LEAFGANFPEFSHEQILDLLQKNSFDIENTYLQLSDMKNFGDIEFNSADDYIIMNLQATDYYKDLIAKKGIRSVEKRHKFMNIEYDFGYY